MNKYPESKLKVFAIDTLFDILGAILYSFGVYTFAANAEFAPSGFTGLAVIVNYYLPFIRIGLASILLNVPVMILCYRFLGKKFLLKSIKSMLLTAVVMDYIFPLFPQYPANDRMIAALFAGVLSGAGLAFIYSRGSSAGGTDFIVFSIKKAHPHLSLGSIAMIANGLVVVLGGFVFKQLESVLFGIIMTAITVIVMDKMMYGFGSGKLAIIITNKGAELASTIDDEVDRGSTIIQGRGGYTGNERDMLFCACSNSEAMKVRNIVRRSDPSAIVILSTIDEVYGMGFKNIQE